MSSWIKVECVVRVNETCSFMRHAPEVVLTPDDDGFDLTMKEERIVGVGHGPRH